MCDRFITSRATGRFGPALFLIALVSGAPAGTAAAQPPEATAQCRPAGSIVKVPELPEASGLAIDRRMPGRLWALNDSGDPVLFALDTNGVVTGRLRVTGARVEDWEAVAVGPCPAGSCIYIGDIGDNDRNRERITVYRVAEPEGRRDTTAVADVFHATYPDGPHDAESLLITRDGRLYVVTKGDTGPVTVYRFPAELRSGSTPPLERVGKPREAGKPADDYRITDGAVSPDGEWVVLRTNHALSFYRTAELLAGNWREARRVDLEPLGEPQGEGVALGVDNSVFVAGESGGKSRSGTFARLTCAPLR
jgi:hypothetical protein